eukprot:CAMPEP_0168171616 /NCGR_PEP_ID=MMETSP0139_2-20121125/4796_1 /TAXON_ID=44445 /ORGANISM="Pseudo-nitzschia australis, Strain 10249 10 AB" /LENGTH=208 /DNA_ID=CAMNT_0008089173 /DNA_START=120 /DNA_END=743 /DNA_ORIENTATION=-
MANKFKRSTRSTPAKLSRPRHQTSLPFVSPAKAPFAVPMDLSSDDEDMTQPTFTSTTTPTLEVLSKTLRTPPAAAVAESAVVLAADAVVDLATASDSSSSSSASTASLNGKPAALKTPPKPKSDTAAAAAASTSAAILKAPNQKVKSSHLWSFEGAGRFLSTPARAAAWKACPGHVRTTNGALTRYFSKEDGVDKASIHDQCLQALPQ